MKRRGIAFILMMSLLPANFVLADDNEQVNIDLTSYIDSDLFIKTSKRAKSDYDDGLWYYDGSKYGSTVTLGDMTYNLDGNMDTRANDVIKIDSSDVIISLDNSASRNIGIMLFTREEQSDSEITVTVNYEGSKNDKYKINVPAMSDENSNSTGYNPLEVVETQGLFYPEVDTSDLVYLHDVILDTSKSVNKALNVQSITLPAADFTYYVAAITQVKFSEEELEEQTKQAVAELYEKYSEIDFVELYEGKDGVSYNEAQELYSAMLKQEGQMEAATAENIEKIATLIEGCELYTEIKGYKEKIEGLLADYPEKSADFTELSETDLTDEDFENLKKLLELYENAEEFDKVRFDEIVALYDVADDIDVTINMENEEKIKVLHDAYEKATKKTELKEKIDKDYSTYIAKDISEITSSDLDKLEVLVGYFDEADEAGIEFTEYNAAYIRHLYEDFESYQTSEERKTIDITSYYNIDMFGVLGEMADASTWYESADNLAGERFATANHSGIRSYDKSTGIIYLKEYEYVENSSYDPATEITTVTYPFTDTGKDIPFYMPEKVFKTGICDGLLVEANSDAEYVFDMSGSYTDKLYFTIASKGQGTISPTVTYTDGTTASYSISVNQTGQTVNATRNKAKTYPDMVNTVTSGNYKDQNMANTGILYEASGNTTNGLSTFAATLNAEKIPVSVKFAAASFEYVLCGVAEKPVDNSVMIERIEKLYNELIKDGDVNINNLSKVSELVINYNEAEKRGIYFEDIDAEIMEELAPLSEITELGKTTVETNQTADYKAPYLNLKTDVVKIEGITPSGEEDREVSVVVYSPDNEIFYAGTVKTNEDGYFMAEVSVPTEEIAESGCLTVKIGGEDFESACVIDDLYFPILADRLDILSILKNAESVSEISGALKAAEEKLSLNFTPFNELVKNDSTLTVLAERIYEIKAELPAVNDSDSEETKKEKISGVQNVIKQQSVFECIKQNKKELIVSNSELMYDDIMAYSSIDEGGVTLYNLYENKMSDAGKKAVIDGLLGNNYKNVEELYDDLEELIMLNALKYPKESGVGHVEVALTKENADAVDMTITNYLNLKDKSAANSYIANMNISKLSDVTDYIKKLSGSGASEKPSKGSSGNSSGSSSGAIAIVPTTDLKENEIVSNKPLFTDIDNSHWAYNAVADLTNKGIINGKGNGVFAPDSTVTRAEFVKMLCIAKDIKAEGPISFRDVERYAWYEEYVAAAFNAGLVKGISENEFGVNLPISRQDICTILYRSLKVNEENELQFADSESIAEYATDAVAYFAKEGVVNGFEDATFRPAAKCTRAQAAMIIYNYLNM